MNWIVEAAQSADPREDRVILENPATVKELDELLIEKFYPPIRHSCSGSWQKKRSRE